MTKTLSPQRAANEISVILRDVLGKDRFAIDIKNVAKEISKAKFPDDPISMIRGDDLPGFEGALRPAPPGKNGWGIIYNNSITSQGRINFTIAHEFGHYLLHRIEHPNGFQCSQDDLRNWNSEYGKLEQQANEFAATLLMPLDDFRKQIDTKDCPSLDDIGDCADRYNVSLIAATLRWLQYTSKRSVFVASRDGFILWARSSTPALRSRLYYKTRDCPPVELPNTSLAMQRSLVIDNRGVIEHDYKVWLDQPCKEYVLFADQYDMVLSLLHFDDHIPRLELDEESEMDAFEFIANRTR